MLTSSRGGPRKALYNKMSQDSSPRLRVYGAAMLASVYIAFPFRSAFVAVVNFLGSLLQHEA